jgi:carboxymethylenebutenolidase
MHDVLESEAKALATIEPNMSRRRFVATSALATGFALAAQPICAQTAITTDADGLIAGDIRIPVGKDSIPGYSALPAGGKNLPVVLVIHEIFGLHEHIKDVSRRLAHRGYLAVAPDLFSRVGDVTKLKTIDEIRPVVAKVADADVMGDLDAAASYAAGTGKVDAKKLAVTGFCGGGRYTWLYAAHSPKLKAGVSWYGQLTGAPTAERPKNAIDLAKDVKCPVLGLYGEADGGIPVEQVLQMRAALAAANKKSEIILYPDTPHAFNADYRPTYRAQQAQDGWAKMLHWFRKNGVA